MYAMVESTPMLCLHAMKNKCVMALLLVGLGLFVVDLHHSFAVAFIHPSHNPRYRATLGSSVVLAPLPKIHHSAMIPIVAVYEQYKGGGHMHRQQDANSMINIPRLTHIETQELLSHAVEQRRIKNIESDLALQSPSLRPSRLELCRLAGYEDDLQKLGEAWDRGLQARDTLVMRNMGLVHHCVKEITGRNQQDGRGRRLQSLSYDDLIQEGAIGLARAVDKWNPEIGGKFSTYAVYWIRAATLRCIAERDELVRVPEHVLGTVRKVTKAANMLGIEVDGNNLLTSWYGSSWKDAETAKALAIEAGLTSRQVQEAIKVKQRRSKGVLSFEAWMQNGRDYETDLAPFVGVEDNAMSSLHLQDIKHTLALFLRPKEIEAISWRYGLNIDADVQENVVDPKSGNTLPVRGKWGEAMSFVEVGKKMQVSAEYGRKLCHAALAKLRKAAKEGTLEPAFLFR